MLGLVPFNVSVKMDDGVACALSKLADSTAMRGAVSSTTIQRLKEVREMYREEHYEHQQRQMQSLASRME